MKEIVNDWNNKFPTLAKYTPQGLFMVAKPFLIGLRFLKSKFGGNEYRVYFVLCPLWEIPESFSIDKPLIFAEVMQTNKNQFFIDFRRHEELFIEAVNCTISQFGEVLRMQISLKNFIKILNRYIKDAFIASDQPLRQIPFFQIAFAIAIYFNQEELYNYTVNTLNKNLRKWKNLKFKENNIGNLFKDKYTEVKVHYILNHESVYRYSDAFIEKLKNLIFEDFRDREQFFARIEENCKKPKIAKLNEGKFVGIDDFKPPKTFWDKVWAMLKLLKQS